MACPKYPSREQDAPAGNSVMIGVGDAGCDSGACSEVAGDGCWRADSGANGDCDDSNGIAYDETRMVVKLAMLTAPDKGEMMTVR